MPYLKESDVEEGAGCNALENPVGNILVKRKQKHIIRICDILYKGWVSREEKARYNSLPALKSVKVCHILYFKKYKFKNV
jgi:hypothetical protein